MFIIMMKHACRTFAAENEVDRLCSSTTFKMNLLDERE